MWKGGRVGNNARVGERGSEGGSGLLTQVSRSEHVHFPFSNLAHHFTHLNSPISLSLSLLYTHSLVEAFSSHTAQYSRSQQIPLEEGPRAACQILMSKTKLWGISPVRVKHGAALH